MSLANARTARPVGVGGGRTIGWWGSVLGIVIVGHLVAGMLVATIYLRAFTAVWPPTTVEPGLVLSGAAVGLAVLAAVLTTIADRRMRLGRGLGAAMLVVAAFVAVIAAGLRAGGTILSGWPVTEHAYWSIRWALGAMDVILLLTVGLLTGVAALHVTRRAIRPGVDAELAVVTLWTWALAAFVGASFVTFGAVTGWSG